MEFLEFFRNLNENIDNIYHKNKNKLFQTIE
jgi:hypothetical protein